MSPLVRIKLLHTAVWAILASIVLYMPYAALMRQQAVIIACSLIVLIECAVLAAFGGKCPLTVVAARYTEDRDDNFDIYLPLWLARHNKVIFGSIFLASEALAFWRWISAA